MHSKRRKKGSRRVKAAKPKTSSKASLTLAFLIASALGIASYVAYEIVVNDHCWSWF